MWYINTKIKTKYAENIFQIQTHKLDIKAQSKIGSLDNIKHRPGGGDKKIFDDKEYLKNVDHPITPTPPSQVYYFTNKFSTNFSPAFN